MSSCPLIKITFLTGPNWRKYSAISFFFIHGGRFPTKIFPDCRKTGEVGTSEAVLTAAGVEGITSGEGISGDFSVESLLESQSLLQRGFADSVMVSEMGRFLRGFEGGLESGRGGAGVKLAVSGAGEEGRRR